MSVLGANVRRQRGNQRQAFTQTTDTVIGLRDQGVGLLAVTAPENPRAHRDSLGITLHLQQRAGVETIVTMTTWDKTIVTLQADLLDAHALGVRGVICEAGNPPVLDDYPAVDGIWEVDSLGLVALLAGLNAGRDLDGLPLTTGYAAPHSRRPRFEEADYLAHEVPEVTIPTGTLRAMERAGGGRRGPRGRPAAGGAPAGQRRGGDGGAGQCGHARPAAGPIRPDAV